mmetsp:Transcript_32559/g.78837  ORF Transcript_32559/g.78837 Transcript_32559/m.78837 type:complete len:1006 (+) Transcript_32559:159-3176(+)|eukprot:CAMPEP_0181085192 /NCGR_PEP_ID=MMETSP1071-20121207/5102_1 /TAXON_ID=35127 /ORGANISM="Thalassiosira sp., Strain NH16" /LENGTH=1005 /DNA_ID=CAMNT_0023166985 /DNA_START=81 /DNA_END=3098 /DNA_ORIENTATION=+
MTTPASVDGCIEMPSYNVRHSIATKVAAKKTAKGYTLSEESCNECEMPLMTMNDKSECKVCPAIKKWIQRKNEASGHKKAEDVRHVVETVDEEEDADIRDEAPAQSVDSDEKCGAEIVDTEEKTDVDIASSDETSEAVESKCSDDSDDTKSFARRLEHMNVYKSEDSEDTKSLAKSLEHMNICNSGTVDSEESTRDSFSTSESEDSEDTDAIRARARQIIMDARGRGEWGGADSNDETEDEGVSFVSPTLSTFSSESIEECMIEERAEDIINRARKNLQAEHGLIYPPESIISPMASQKTTSFEEPVPGMGSWDAVIIMQSNARRYLARKQFLGMMFKEKDAMEEAVMQPSPEQFKPLGVNNPTVDKEENSVGKNDHVQEQFSNEDYFDGVQEGQDGGQDLTEGVAQDPAEHANQHADQDADQDADQCLAQKEPTQVVTQDDVKQDIAPDETDVCFDNTQYDVNPNSAEKDTSITDGHVRETIATDSSFVENAIAPRQQEVPTNDYSAVLQKQITPVNAVAPSRGLFANLACKFDDAVADAIGKVHSMVTCANTATNGGYEGGFGEAFEAEQSRHKNDDPQGFAATFSSGQVKYDTLSPRQYNMLSPRQAKYEAQTVLLAMRGWQVANVSCHRCSMNLMFQPQDGHMLCAGCDSIGLQAESTPLVNNALPNQGPVFHHAPPRPEYAVNQAHLNRGLTPTTESYTTTPMGINPLRDVTTEHYGAPKDAHKSTATQALAFPTQNTSLGAPPPPPPGPPVQHIQNWEECASNSKYRQAIVPDQNYTAMCDDAKENDSGDVNVSRQLNDAKLRIEDAKKFIMSRSNRRMNPSSNNFPPLGNISAHGVQTEPFRSQMSMITPGSQAPSATFRPQMGMTTPGSQAPSASFRPQMDMNSQPCGLPMPQRGVSANPGIQTGTFRPQINMTPGSQEDGAYHNHLTAMESLMSMSPGTVASANQDDKNVASGKIFLLSPGNGTNAEAAETSTTSSAGTKNSGHRTPQMPGKYFFA